MKGYIRDIGIILAVILVAVSLSIGIYELMNKNRLDNKVSISLEKNLKDIAKQQILLDSRIVNDKKINSAMQAILLRLTNQIQSSSYDIEVLVVDTPEVNAFTLPGGLIIVNTGLIGAADNPEEVASVLAHELGHVENKDSMQRLTRSIGVSAIVTLSGSGQAGNLAREIIQSGIDAHFTKKQEDEADDYAFDLMVKSGLNPVHFSDFMQKLEGMEKGVNKEIARYAGDHPLLEERIKKAKAKSAEFKGPEKKIGLSWKQIRSRIQSIFKE